MKLQKGKKRFIIVLSLLVIAVIFTACAAGPNNLEKSVDTDGNVAGFLNGIWHGFILLFSFIVSLFSDKVSVYEVHNNGAFYNLGFLLGVSIFFSGSGGAGSRARNRHND